MAPQAHYNLILGIKTKLKKVFIEVNPDSKNYDDNDIPRYIITDASNSDWENYVLPNGSILESLEHAGEINKKVPINPLEELVLESDDFWLEGDDFDPFQVLGINLVSHSGGGCLPADKDQIKRGLEMNGKVVEMINKYGFNVTKADIGLYQVLIPYDD